MHLLYAVPLAFYACLYAIYAALSVAALVALRRRKVPSRAELARIAGDPSTPGITLIVPAYNEEMIILNAIRGTLNLHFPRFDVIVINDGSTDSTLATLIEGFGLHRTAETGQGKLATKPVRGVHRSVACPNLIVVDKENGRRADAINAGVNLATTELLFIMDADSILEEDTLLRSVQPFIEDSRVVGVGGVVRPINGLRVQDGHIRRFALPRGFLSLMQAVEYFRGFQWARLGMARLHSMLSISGAFMVVRRDVFIGLGGCSANTITDDIEFTIRLHRYAYDRRNPNPAKVIYLPDAVSYTEVPETLRILAAQRNRWQRGILQSLRWHRGMAFNPRFGMTGLIGLPFFILLCLAPLMEAASYLAILIGLVIGAVSPGQFMVFMGAVVLLGLALTLMAALLQRKTGGQAISLGDLLLLIAVGSLESLGYQQMHIGWRIAGTIQYVLHGRSDLGAMMRYGTYQEVPVTAATGTQQQGSKLRAAE